MWEAGRVSAMTVRGTQLLLPDGLSASATADTLAGQIPIVTQRAHVIERTFWDSFDGRVHGAGLALIDSPQGLILADSTTYAEVARGKRPGRSQRLLVDDLPPGELRERLAPLLEMRALTPVARVRSRTLPVSVLDDEGKTVVRLRVEEASARLDGDTSAPLRARLHVVGVRGYDDELERVRALLAETLGLGEAARPVQDDAVAATGGTPGGVSSKLRVTLRADQRADAAAVVVLRELLSALEANLPGTIADVDSEFLHDLRVSVRRTRALQRELAGVFPAQPLRRFRDEFKELQRITGPTRDLDVQLLEFDELARALPATIAPDVAPLRALLEEHRRAEQRKMARALRSAAVAALRQDWPAFLDDLTEADAADRPAAGRPIGDVAGTRIVKVYKRMRRMGSAIDDASPHEALHELRKQGKELRYLLEFFSSLYPAEVVKPVVGSLKALQDVLGRFQDREVQAEELRSLGDQVAALDGGAAALMAMGVLVQRLHDDQRESREQFAERFEQFAAKSQRRLVSQTFG